MRRVPGTGFGGNGRRRQRCRRRTGRSGATPIIRGERIFLNIGTTDGGGDLELWALDRANGRIRWKRHIAGGNHIERKQNMSSPSPVTDGHTVWVMTGGSPRIRCGDAAEDAVTTRAAC